MLINCLLNLSRFKMLFYALPYIDTILYIKAPETKKKHPFECFPSVCFSLFLVYLYCVAFYFYRAVKVINSETS
jgi:hypothetical protein